jgi:DNA polymerase theta
VIAGKLFVSADYCQLELRVLAHLAKDSVLCSVLKSSCDVFRKIAATWNQVAESDVSNSYFYQITWHYISGNCSFGISCSSAISICNIRAKM